MTLGIYGPETQAYSINKATTERLGALPINGGAERGEGEQQCC